MRATLSNYRQSPRKVRLVADSIRGKTVSQALTELSFLQKRAAEPMKKLLLSALANAKRMGKDVEALVIRDLQVGGGTVFKRLEYRARGSANIIKKRTSNISISLAEKPQSKKENLQSKNEKPVASS